MAPDTVYTSDEQAVGLYREIARRVSSLPGVESAGMTSMLPVQCNCPIDTIQFSARPYHGEHNDVNERHVSAEYLSTLKASLLRGRIFTDAEDASRPGVTVINQHRTHRTLRSQRASVWTNLRRPFPIVRAYPDTCEPRERAPLLGDSVWRDLVPTFQGFVR
jgi:hypothetical protein